MDNYVVKGRMGLCVGFGNHCRQEEIQRWIYEQYEMLKVFLLEKQKSSRDVCWFSGEENVCFSSQVYLPPGDDIHY